MATGAASDVNLVLAAYEDASSSGEARLSDWIARYPEHADDLTRFAALSYILEHAGDAKGGEELEARIAEIVAQARGKMRDRESKRAATPLAGIVEQANAMGIGVPELARRVGLSPLEIVKLNQRLFRASTLPRIVVARLAEALERTFDEVASYLRQPPMLAAQAAYRAREAPRVRDSESFEAAVSASTSLDAAQRSFWREACESTLGEG